MERTTAVSSSEAINERYRVVRYLGRGGMGDVCLVQDNLRGGRQLALKRLRKDKLDSRSVSILRTEFLSLVSLPHPNLARVFDFGVDRRGGDLFFTAEFVDGTSWFEATRDLPFDRDEGIETLLGVLAQVLRALDFVHCHGLVHCDIKPDNLLVLSRKDLEEGEAFGSQVKVIDFGLAKKERVPGEDRVLGTPYYVAPETILGGSLDRRTDLYSLGVVLYQIVTGRPPFLGDSNLEILRSHVERAPTPPQKLVPGLSPLLGDVILRLMEKRPRDRFQGALELLDHINRAFGISIELETPESMGSYPEAAALVGREKERADLRAVFLDALGMEPMTLESSVDFPLLQGELHAAVEASAVKPGLPPGRMVILHGEPGLGKRRLVGELRQLGQTLGARFMEVECRESGEEGGGGLESLLSELARFDWQDWEKGLPARTQSAFLLAGAPRKGRGDGPSREIEKAFEEVSLALLESSQDQPTAIHFQDVHLAGKAVVEFVRILVGCASSGRGGSNRLFISATAAEGGAGGGGEFLKLRENAFFLSQVLDLRVQRLDEEQVSRFLQAAFPGAQFPQKFHRRILEQSDGNLDAVVSTLNRLLSKGKIARTIRGWRLQGDYEDEGFSGRARGELKERLARLPPDALKLAMALACLGQSSELEPAVQLAAVPRRAVERSLKLLGREKILERRAGKGGAALYGFVHSRFRTILYEAIPAEKLGQMHARAGAILEALPHDERDLAVHFLRAGDAEKGIEYGVHAARELADAGALQQASELYEQVLSLAEAAKHKDVLVLSKELAAVRSQAGDYSGVLELLGPLCAPGSKGEGDAEAYTDAALAHAKLGHFEQAASLLEKAGELAGREKTPERAHGVRLAEAECLFWKGDLVESLRRARGLVEEEPRMRDIVTRCRLHMLLSEALALLNHKSEAADHCQTALRLMDVQHDERLRAWSLFCRGKYFLYKDQLPKALKQFRLCLVLRNGSHAAEGKAECLYELGWIHHRMGKHRSARPLLQEALKLSERSRQLPRTIETLSLLAEVYRLLGDTERWQGVLKDLLPRARSLEGSRIILGTLLSCAAHAVDTGNLSGARRYLREAQSYTSQAKGTGAGILRVLELQCTISLHAGALAAALAEAVRGTVQAREMGDIRHQAGFLVLQAEILYALGRDGEARQVLVGLSDVVERHEIGGADARARVLQAALVARKGKPERAEELFSEARESVRRHGSERDLIRFRLEYGLLCLARGELEQAYLNLEEGLHATGELRLAYVRSRFLLAMGELELALDSGDGSRAAGRFGAAERVAVEKGYPETAWKAQLRLWSLCQRAGESSKAEAWLRKARATLQTVLDGLPENYRESYQGQASNTGTTR